MFYLQNISKKYLVTASILATVSTASAFEIQGDIWLKANVGLIDYSTITVISDKNESTDVGLQYINNPQQMYNNGYKTSDGKFAMKMFHYGSGTGLFDISPLPNSFEVIFDGGAVTNLTGNHFISSADAQYTTILATWDTIPTSLSYTCDDYCLVSPLGTVVGIDDNLSYEQDNNVTTASNSYNIKNGWQLLGAVNDINTSVFDNKCADIMWKYDSGSWLLHIANGQNYEIPSGITMFTSINKGEGFWVMSDDNTGCTISLDSNETKTVVDVISVGVYEGDIYQDGYGSWGAKVSIADNNYTVDYPSLNCGSQLTVDSINSDGTEVKFTEKLTYGSTADCADNGTVILTKTAVNTTVKYSYVYSGGTTVSAEGNVSLVVAPTVFQSGDTWKGLVYETLTSPTTSKIWLDRNLGASQACTSSIDTACYGDYYQWGREADGHQLTTSLSEATQVSDIKDIGSNFLTYSVNNDWTSADSDGALRSANWSKTDGSSICPVGFRVPTKDEWTQEAFSNVSDAYTKLKLSASGGRQSGDASVYATGNSWYWTSNVAIVTNNQQASFLNTTNSSSKIETYNRATGFPIRCIKN